jgi:hypothetical protein
MKENILHLVSGECFFVCRKNGNLLLMVGGAGVYLLMNSPEQQVLGWVMVATGILFLLLTILYYVARIGRKRHKPDCIDCTFLPDDCDPFHDCDLLPDCNCNCD